VSEYESPTASKSRWDSDGEEKESPRRRRTPSTGSDDGSRVGGRTRWDEDDEPVAVEIEVSDSLVGSLVEGEAVVMVQQEVGMYEGGEEGRREKGEEEGGRRLEEEEGGREEGGGR
jgi:hypothetical protein